MTRIDAHTAGPLARPTGNNADEWAAWLSENIDAGIAFLAVQIAEAMDESEERSKLLDRMQTTRLLVTSEGHAVCVGGRFDGWAMWQHPDGQWVSGRKLAQVRPQAEGSSS